MSGTNLKRTAVLTAGVAALLGVFCSTVMGLIPAEKVAERTAQKQNVARQEYHSQAAKRTSTRGQAIAGLEKQQSDEARRRRQEYQAQIAKMKADAKKRRVAEAKQRQMFEAEAKKAATAEKARLASVADIVVQCKDEKGSPVSGLAVTLVPSYTDPGQDRVARVVYPSPDYKPQQTLATTDANGVAVFSKQKCYLYTYGIETEQEKRGSSSVSDVPEWALADGQTTAFSLPERSRKMSVDLKFKRLKGDIDISGPEGAEVMIGQQKLGTTPCRIALPLELGGKRLKLALVKPTEAGTMAGNVEIPKLDGYEVTKIDGPQLTIQTISKVEIAHNIDVGMSEAAVVAALGKPEKLDPKTMIEITGQPGKKAQDGSKTYEYPSKGLSLKIRNEKVDDKEGKVDVITITGPEGGKVAGIAVGDDSAKIAAVLGEGSQAEANPRTIRYLDNSVRFEKASLKVKSIQIARRAQLIKSGTPAFVRPDRPKFYFGEMGDDTVGRALRQMIDSIGPYVTVSDRADADYEITARSTGTNATRTRGSVKRKDRKKGEYTVYYTDVIATAGVAVTVRDLATGEALPGLNDHSYTGSVTERIYDDSETDAGDDVYKARAMEQAALVSLDELYKVRPIVAQVTKVDYTTCQVWINIGQEDGIQKRSPSQRPTEFVIKINGVELPASKSRYVEATEDVRSDYCVLDLTRKKIGSGGQDWDTVFVIPDPACAEVTAWMVPPHWQKPSNSKGGSTLGDWLKKL